jgi:predicted dinucleotide-binding enzyme
MKIGIIGSGHIGGALGPLWAKAGHEVFYSSRHPDQLQDLVRRTGPKAQAGSLEAAAGFGEVILLAVPFGALPELGPRIAPLLAGKAGARYRQPLFPA